MIGLEELTALGYVGVFLAAFLLNLMPFTNPTNPFIVLIVIQIAPQLNPLAVGVLVALGATLSKVVHYGVSYGLARKLKLKSLREKGETLRRFGFVAAYLAAATPLPDDWAAIPLALTGFSLARFTLGFLLGKLTTCATAGLLGESVIGFLEESLGVWGTIISFTGTVALIAVILLGGNRVEEITMKILEKLKLKKILKIEG